MYRWIEMYVSKWETTNIVNSTKKENNIRIELLYFPMKLQECHSIANDDKVLTKYINARKVAWHNPQTIGSN